MRIGIVSLFPRLVAYYEIAVAKQLEDINDAHQEIIEGHTYLARYMGENLFKEWPESLRAIIAKDLRHQREKECEQNDG